MELPSKFIPMVPTFARSRSVGVVQTQQVAGKVVFHARSSFRPLLKEPQTCTNSLLKEPKHALIQRKKKKGKLNSWKNSFLPPLMISLSFYLNPLYLKPFLFLNTAQQRLPATKTVHSGSFLSLYPLTKTLMPFYLPQQVFTSVFYYNSVAA